MDIRELTFAAFGPFTDHPTLSFERGNGRFHVIYGPNEAGKSSALRGLKALLYGIDERTPDNFLHANDKLRIGGRLYAQDGRQLTFRRRKGRKNTILDANGTALDDAALAPFLNGVSEQLFEMLFGIDHRALVQGGEDILAQRGDVGQALFSASLGSHALHAVLADLDREADELFKARGSTPRINAAIKDHKALTSQIRACSLSSQKWEDNRRALKRSNRDLQQVQDQLARDRAEINRLKRVQRCLPRLAQCEALQGRIEALADVIVLAGDFGNRHRVASNELDKAQSIIRQSGLRIESRESELAALQVRQSVLDDAENIEALHALLGSHRKALQDKPHLEAEHKQLLADMENLINDVRPGLDPALLETLRPALTQRTRISTLGSDYPGLASRAKAAGKNLRDTERQLEEARQALAALPAADSPAALRQAIAEARKAGDIDAQIQSMRSEHDSLKARCEHDLARLSLWTGSLEALNRLELPSQETVLRVEDKHGDLARRTASLHDKQTDNSDTSLETASRLDAIQRVGAVPSEQELTELRSNRDEVWQLVRRQWIDGEDVSAQARAIDAQHALPDAFELRLSATDEIADRLRREAERVHTQASLQAQEKELDQRASNIAGQIEQCDAERTQLDSEWNALWRSCNIQPLSPREMRGWLERVDKLRELIEHFNEVERKLAALEKAREMFKQSIQKQVRNLGSTSRATVSLEAVLTESEELATENERIRQQREASNKSIRNLEQQGITQRTEQQSTCGELEAWTAKWAEAVGALGLTGDALPQEAADVIDKFRDLFAKQSDAEKLQIRIRAIDSDARSFQQQSVALAARVAPELQALPADASATRLNALLSDNKDRQSQRQQIDTQLKEAREDKQSAEDTAKTMKARLDTLCRETQCANPAELEEAERRSNEKRQLEKDLANLEQSILDSGEGSTLAELVAEAREVDADGLPAAIQTLTHSIDEELEPTRTTLAETKGGLNKERELMDGSDQAAALADQDQLVLSEIRSDSERYVRLKLAARLLRDEIEHYREENQGPLIERASEHFSALTLGSFEALHTDFNDKDEPLLVGLRSNRERVRVEGMSSGTRDQLYLALRLASLEKYMESIEPMPFIVDDILVDFDDERSQAALKALALLSQKTQVVLFTHHSSVVEQARALKPAHANIHTL